MPPTTPKYNISLEQLAEQGAIIYLDNCVLNRAYNLADIRNSVQNYDFPISGFAQRIGKCKRFSNLRIAPLRREVTLAFSWRSMLQRYPAMRSVPQVADEHLEYKEHMERVFPFLRKNSVCRSGERERLFQHMLEYHREIQAVLRERSLPHPKAKEITDFLCQNRMNQPQGELFRKRYAAVEDTTLADASLVSHALLEQHAGEVAIVTADADIINLLRNYYHLQLEGRLPPPFPPARQLAVYFPHEQDWFPRLLLSRSYHTKRLLNAGYSPGHGTPYTAEGS